MSTVGFHHGVMCDAYEEQARSQGYTFGDNAEWVEKVGYGLKCAYIHGCITDGEFNKIMQKFQEKILSKTLKPLSEERIGNEINHRDT